MTVSLNSNIKIVEKTRKLNTKASEEYVHVEFTYLDEKRDIWIPVEYRRTGVSIKADDTNGLYEHLNKVYIQMNPANYSSWLKIQDAYWANSRSDVTKPIFNILKDGKWHCRNCDIDNANFARRIQDLKEMGYTIATHINYNCPVCHNNRSTRLLLLPIERVEIAGNGYETWSPALRKRILNVLDNYDVYEGKESQHLLPDHKFSEIRWDEDTKSENPDTMTDTEIKEKFQLLSNQRNQQKREVCRICYQTGKRGTIYGFPPLFYEGGKDWDKSIPVKGKAAEKGCIGCPWYDIQRWKEMIIEQLPKMKNNFNTTGGETLKTNRYCYLPGNDELSICHEHENNMQYPLESIEMSLTEVFASMKNTGVRISLDEVHRFDEYLTKIIERTKQAIYDETGHEFNISSPKQLGTVLFEELGLPTRWRYSERLIETFPIVDNVRKYRMYMKIYTYVTGLYNNIASDDRLHICYNQTDTRTGRISTCEPNIQNIPVHTELGSQLRKFFIAEKGRVLINAEYKQIELRVMAHLCGDKNMIEAFTSGEDIHSSTAALLFDIPIYMVTSEMREIAKAVNFSIIYGIGAFSLSKDIGTSFEQAQKYIQKYHEKYPKVNKFIEKIVSDAKKTGKAVTLFGRKCHIPELSSSNKIIQATGKRIAMNYPIQGTVADIIKIAMIKVYHRLKAEKLPAQLVLQVNDELIIESDISCVERCQKILCEEMQNVYNMKVPLIVDIHQGANWYETRKK